jgi:hypothetical protein
VFNRRQPYIDRGAGASIEGWGTLLETVHGRFSDDTVFVFGHAGDGYSVIGDRSDLLVMRDFLAALREAAEQAARDLPDADGGERTQALVATTLDGFEAWGPLPQRVAGPAVDEFARPE